LGRRPEDRPIERDERNTQLLRERDIAGVICRESASNPTSDTTKIRLEELELRTVQFFSELEKLLLSPPPLTSCDVKEFQKK